MTEIVSIEIEQRINARIERQQQEQRASQVCPVRMTASELMQDRTAEMHARHGRMMERRERRRLAMPLSQ
jgi:hypothetical protein